MSAFAKGSSRQLLGSVLIAALVASQISVVLFAFSHQTDAGLTASLSQAGFGNVGSSEPGTSNSVSGVSLGATAPDRDLLITTWVIGSETSPEPTTLTVNGQSATLVDYVQATSCACGFDWVISVWRIDAGGGSPLAADTSGTIVWAYDEAADFWSVQVVRATGLGAQYGSTAKDMTQADGLLDVGVNTTNGGVVLAAAATWYSNSFAWSGVTEILDTWVVYDYENISAAIADTASGETPRAITATFTEDYEDANSYVAMSIAFSPAEAEEEEEEAPPRTIILDAGLIRFISGKIVVLAQGEGGGAGPVYEEEEEPEPEWTPLALDKLVAWWDAADLETLAQNADGTDAVAVDGDPVGYWRDKAGNFTLLQASSAMRARWGTSGGASYVQGAAAADFEPHYLAGGYNFGGSAIELVMVARSQTTGAIHLQLLQGNAAEFGYGNTGPSATIMAVNFNWFESHPLSTTHGIDYIVGWTYQGPNVTGGSQGWLNGAMVNSKNPPSWALSPSVLDGIQLFRVSGDWVTSPARFYDILIFDDLLTIEERDQLTVWLAAKNEVEL